MATLSRQEIYTLLTTIRDERKTHANTAYRVGEAMLALLTYLEDGQDGKFLSKINDDTAQGFIKFNRGLKIGDAVLTWDPDNGGLRVSTGLYSDSFISALGANADAGGGTAGAGYLSDLKDVALGTLTSGQMLTYDSILKKWTNKTLQQGLDSSQLAAYLTDNGYATQSWVNNQGFLKTHQSLADYATKTMLTDGSVTKVGTASVGSASLPIYLNAGVPTACTGSSVFSALTTSGNSISITVAGQNRTLTVPYATNAGRIAETMHYSSSGLDLNACATNEFSGTIHTGSGGSPWTNGPSEMTDADGKGLFTVRSASGYFGQLLFTTGNKTPFFRMTNGSDNAGWVSLAHTGSTVEAANRLATARTLWGQSFNGTGNVSGDMTGVGSITASGVIGTTSSVNAQSLELSHSTPFIDFHFGKSADDCTARIIEYASGTLTLLKRVQIGSYSAPTIEWDSANNAIKFNGNIYATGWISALGANPDAGGGTAGASYLADLKDVAVGTPTGGQVLTYNGKYWVAQTVSAGGLDESQLASYLTRNAYATQSWVNNQGFLKTHQSLDGYARTEDVTRTLTIQRNGAQVDTYNGTAAKTINISVPTNTNELANGAGFITVSSVTWANLTGKPTTLAGYGITDAKIAGGVITLGNNSIMPLTEHQSIHALTLQAGAFSAKTYTPNSAAQTVSIPTQTSHLTNNSGFITADATVAAANKLATARTLWGQSFDGTNNVSGQLTGVGGIKDSNGNWVLNFGEDYILFGSMAESAANTLNRMIIRANGLTIQAKTGRYDITINPDTGNVGIGVNNASYKLHVAGTLYASGASTLASTLSVTGAATMSSSLTVTGKVRTSNVFSAGDGTADDTYGYVNVTRPAATNNASCFSWVRQGSKAFGLGYDTSNRIVMGEANASKVITPWLTVYNGSLRIGNSPAFEWDSENNAIKFNGNIYATGWISALGANPDAGGGGGASYLSELKDVSLGTPAIGQVLTYNGKYWVAASVQGGGLDTTQLAAYLTSNGYATQSWVTGTALGGYAKTADVTKTLTIQRNGTQVDTYNGTAAKTINISVPTNTNELANGAGFITVSSVTWANLTGKPTTLAGYGITDAKIAGGVITLGNNSITPLTEHQSIHALTLQAGAFSAKTYTPNSAAQTVSIPTQTSHLTNNSGFITSDATVSAANRLATARTLWGQSFDGSKNVSGDMTGVGGITASGTITCNYVGIATTSPEYRLDVNGSARVTVLYGADGRRLAWHSSEDGSTFFGDYTTSEHRVVVRGLGLLLQGKVGRYDITVNADTGNVGIGTNAPSYKLHVEGTLYARGASTLASTLSVTGAATMSSSLTVTGKVRTSNVFSAGDGTADDTYGYVNVTRPAATNNASCFSWVRQGSKAFGLGYDTSNRIVMGEANASKVITPWLTVYNGSLRIGNSPAFEWDSENNAIKFNGNFYTTGWISALGANPDAGGGGGASYLSELKDVSLGTPAIGQVLTYNGKYWVAASVQGGGLDTTQLAAYLTSNGYATQSWVTGTALGGYAKTADVTKTLTIQRNGTQVDTYNGTAAKTINISVPTNTNELANGAGFITVSSVTWANLTGKPTTLAGYGITDAKIAGGVITLGSESITPLTEHQAIHALTLQAGAFSAKTYTPNSAAQTVSIPTQTSHLTNNSGFITSDATVSAANKLATARTLWGQSFDGTNNVSGQLTGVGGIKDSNGNWVLNFGADYILFGSMAESAANTLNRMIIRANGITIQAKTGRYDITVNADTANVGIGVNNASYKLHVAGTLYASGASTLASTLSVTGAATMSSSLTVTGKVRTSNVFSAGDGTADDAYGYVNVTRPAATNNASCFSWVRQGSKAFGLGYDTSNRIVMGEASASKVITPWLTVYNGSLRIGNSPAFEWDSENNAIKFNGNFYTTGWISALGANPDAGGGGGASYLSELKDVAVGTPTGGQVLTYDGSKWVAKNGITDYMTLKTDQNISSTKTWSAMSSGQSVSAGNTSISISMVGITFNHRSIGVADRDNPSSGGSVDTPVVLSTRSAGTLSIGTDIIATRTWVQSQGSSDERLKDITHDVDIDVRTIAEAPSVAFKWKDRNGSGAGSLAQYWQKVLPHNVVADGKGYLTMQYGNIALMSAISIARRVVSHEKRIAQLERENERLKKEIKQLKSA